MSPDYKFFGGGAFAKKSQKDSCDENLLDDFFEERDGCQSDSYVPLQYDAESVVCGMQHHHTFQSISELPVFTRERWAEAKTF